MPTQAFNLVSKHDPVGDQPGAIDALIRSIEGGSRYQTLLGVTGSGKTFTMANVIARLNRPTIIVAHNKTLAAQLYGEFKKFFPDNAVEYFVSFYDYYQPEAYVPRTDTFIEKDMQINDQIDRMRHSATRSLLDRQDVIIVASVSCIYGLGSPEAYAGALVYCELGDEYPRREMLKKLVEIAYKRNDFDLKPGTFRVRGDTMDVFPMYEDSKVIRFEFFGDEVDSILEIDSLTGEIYGELEKVTIYPATHYVTPEHVIERACASIRKEMEVVVRGFNKRDKLLEAQRIEQRTNYDLETLEQTGTCYGIENYSAHLEARAPGEKPPTLLDYLPKNAIIMVDESHQTIPQFGGMYRGDRSRKETLVEHGFRLPSALDNRPLKFEEFESIERATVFVSATPGPYELEKCPESAIVPQIIRPTGLIDPEIEVRPVKGQIDDLMEQIRQTVERKERALVCTLTKRMAEELTDYYDGLGIQVRYLHSEIDTIERMELLRSLRKGEYDVLVGINLLREGLDLPEVSLVAVLDADKEGFLRSARSLIQIVGRAARNVNGRVIFYADKVTDSMSQCIDETNRRREIQMQYNEANGITPETIYSPIQDSLHEVMDADFTAPEIEEETVAETLRKRTASGRKGRGRKIYKEQEVESVLKEIVPEAYNEHSTEHESLDKIIAKLTEAMEKAAAALEFEKAALLRDEIKQLQSLDLGLRI